MQIYKRSDKGGLPCFLVLISVIALLTLSSCGGGTGSAGGGNDDGGNDGGGDTTDSNYPPAGAIFAEGAIPAFTATYTRPEITDISFRFFLVTEDGQMTIGVAESDDIAGDQNGAATWSPGIKLLENRPYTWRWEVTYKRNGVSGSYDSEARTIYVLKSGGLAVMSPRDGGYMDISPSSESHLAIKNAFTFGGPTVKYDFEIYKDRGLTNLVASKSGVIRDNDNEYTAWENVNKRIDGGEHYWRARVTINGNASDWSGPYSFTLINLCNISGSAYAEHVIDWIEYSPCDQLILTNPDAALGPPSAGGFVSQDQPGYGFISMGHNSELIVEMGHTVLDGPGNDIGVHEYVSREPVELYVGKSEIGPWYPMGIIWCHYRCDFDLSVAGVSYARYFKIRSIPGRCYQTAGPDIHSFETLNLTSNEGQCL